MVPPFCAQRAVDDACKQVKRIEGVFSGTMSYIFNNFSTGEAQGPSFSDVVSEARQNGYTVCLSSPSKVV